MEKGPGLGVGIGMCRCCWGRGGIRRIGEVEGGWIKRYRGWIWDDYVWLIYGFGDDTPKRVETLTEFLGYLSVLKEQQEAELILVIQQKLLAFS